MRIGIVGSRRRNFAEDKKLLQKTLLEIYEHGDTLVSGGCPVGADYFAEELSREFNIPIMIYHPDKSKLDKNSYWSYVEMYHNRNTLIANNSDILIALVMPDRKGGTEDTIKKFLKGNSKKNLFLL